MDVSTKKTQIKVMGNLNLLIKSQVKIYRCFDTPLWTHYHLSLNLLVFILTFIHAKEINKVGQDECSANMFQ